MVDRAMSELRHDPVGGAPATMFKDTLIVDTDVHMFPTIEQIKAYMPGRWRRYVEDFGLRTPYGEQSVVRARWMGSRTDAWTPDGRPPGSDPAFTRTQLLDAYDIDLAILNNTMGHAGEYVGGAAPLDLTAALMAAGNEWGADAWLDSDERLYMTMLVPYDDPAATLREIERWGDHPRVVTVGLPVRTHRPIGHRRYWDLIEACVDRDLPLTFHVGYGSTSPLTGVGWPSFYFEDHVNFPHAVQTQVASLICEGVFDRWPTLKVVLQEAGWTWVAPFAWRFDRAWRQAGHEVSDLQRPPSEYVRDHLWYTTQPWEDGEHPHQHAEALEVFGNPDKLLFASDYPHWDFDSPTGTMRAITDPDLRRRIMGANALALYGRLPGSTATA
jgi:uncharacterized protein